MINIIPIEGSEWLKKRSKKGVKGTIQKVPKNFGQVLRETFHFFVNSFNFHFPSKRKT